MHADSGTRRRRCRRPHAAEELPEVGRHDWRLRHVGDGAAVRPDVAARGAGELVAVPRAHGADVDGFGRLRRSAVVCTHGACVGR